MAILMHMFYFSTYTLECVGLGCTGVRCSRQREQFASQILHSQALILLTRKDGMGLS